MSNVVLMWLAIAEGARVTWADYAGYYAPQFYWSATLRGERVVECAFAPTLRLPPP